MPHTWVLFFVITSGWLAPETTNTIFGFGSLESCEFTGHQLSDKMKLKRWACVEIDPERGKPVDQPH